MSPYFDIFEEAQKKCGQPSVNAVENGCKTSAHWESGNESEKEPAISIVHPLHCRVTWVRHGSFWPQSNNL